MKRSRLRIRVKAFSRVENGSINQCDDQKLNQKRGPLMSKKNEKRNKPKKKAMKMSSAKKAKGGYGQTMEYPDCPPMERTAGPDSDQYEEARKRDSEAGG